MISSIFESIRLPTGLLPKKPETNENLRRTNLLINIHDWANPTSLFPLPSFPHFDFAGAWVLACWWMSGNRLVASLPCHGAIVNNRKQNTCKTKHFNQSIDQMAITILKWVVCWASPKSLCTTILIGWKDARFSWIKSSVVPWMTTVRMLTKQICIQTCMNKANMYTNMHEYLLVIS